MPRARGAGWRSPIRARRPRCRPAGSAGALGLLPDRRDAEAEVTLQRSDGRPGDKHVVVGERRTGDRNAEPPGKREHESRSLDGERYLVDKAVTDERRAGQEQDEVQETAAVAEQPVRDDLDEVDRPEPPEHSAAQDDQPAMLEHPHLAPVLLLLVARRLLVRERVRLVDRAAAALHHQVREGEVVPEARVDVDVVLAADRVDGAVAAGDRAEVGLVLTEPDLEPPVDALAVRSVWLLEHDLAADVRNLRVGEAADQLAERVRRPGRVRVGEDEDLAARLWDGVVLSRDLPAAGAADQPHPRFAFDELVRTVVGGIGCDDDLELVRGIVEREQVLEPPLDHVLLVVSGDDQADAWRLVALAHATVEQPRPEGRDERVAEMGPDKQPERDPEEHNEHDHGRSAYGAGRLARISVQCS